MARYYELAEEKIGVAGTGNRPRLPGNNNYKVLEYGAKVLGYKKVHTGNMGINSIERDGRPACQQIGFCMAGCAIGAKWSTLYTEVPKAETTDHFELRPECMALQIEHDASGKVTGVLYADKDGNQHLQKARAVCVAGNSVESPRLLLNSASSKFPDGLANSSGQVGRNFMRHMTGAVYGIMPGPVHLDRGTQMAGIIMDESRFDPARGFVGGYELETLPGFGLAGVAANMKPGAWGREYAQDIDQYRNIACMWIVGEDMPQETNGVTLHSTEKDQYGLPIPIVHFQDHANDVAMRNHAFKAGGDVYRAAGATKVYERGPFSSTHNLGTCRQSERPQDGVCNTSARRTTFRTCSSRTAASSPPAPPRTRRSRSSRWRSARRNISPSNCAAARSEARALRRPRSVSQGPVSPGAGPGSSFVKRERTTRRRGVWQPGLVDVQPLDAVRRVAAGAEPGRAEAARRGPGQLLPFLVGDQAERALGVAVPEVPDLDVERQLVGAVNAVRRLQLAQQRPALGHHAARADQREAVREHVGEPGEGRGASG